VISLKNSSANQFSVNHEIVKSILNLSIPRLRVVVNDTLKKTPWTLMRQLQKPKAAHRVAFLGSTGQPIAGMRCLTD